MSSLYQQPGSSLFSDSQSGSLGLAAVLRLLDRVFVRPLIAAHRARMAYLELSDLDDRQLEDIGLRRAEIAAALTGQAQIVSSSNEIPEAINASRRAA